jgi:hypothetical protein
MISVDSLLREFAGKPFELATFVSLRTQFNYTSPCAVKPAGIVDDMRDGALIIRAIIGDSSAIL